jgi:hypothetical protein
MEHAFRVQASIIWFRKSERCFVVGNRVMASSTELKVHLDHLIRRQNIRFTVPRKDNIAEKDALTDHDNQDRSLRYDDIRRDDWFKRMRKPDFQRETNSWTPEDCVEFLDSVVSMRIIPSIILWYSTETSTTFVLDGAHRLSVVRAWMTDDWGDKAERDYYSRRDPELLRRAANKTRELVQARIGLFEDFRKAHAELQDKVDQGLAPKETMHPSRFNQAQFFRRVVEGLQTFTIQWERGNYESAEQSFLRINRRGQRLDPWEATLIEYRHSSYSRCVMSIANGGESGHYWPASLSDISPELAEKMKGFGEQARSIHKRLFVPPFRSPISDLNAPLLVDTAYFQKHKYLLEIIPLLNDREITTSGESQIKIMKRDANGTPEEIIQNADRILSTMADNLEHVVSPGHSSKSLSIVPLFYCYNQKAQHTRGLLYGFLYWLLSGTEQDITSRKLVFSVYRSRCEYWLFHLKPQIATLQERGGAGLYATTRVAKFFQLLFQAFQERPDLPADSDELRDIVLRILSEHARITAQTGKKSRVVLHLVVVLWYTA